MGTQGWPFASVDQFPGADVDPLYKSEHVKDLYLKADPNYGGRFVFNFPALRSYILKYVWPIGSLSPFFGTRKIIQL